MLDSLFGWLFGQGATAFLGLLFFALVYPVYKAGFFVRQGLTYQKSIAEADTLLIEKRLSLETANPAFVYQYRGTKKRAQLMVVGASLFLLAVASLLLIIATWKLSGLSLLAAAYGYLNVKD